MWERVKLATASDEDLSQLTFIIEVGFLEFRHELPPALQEYSQVLDHFYNCDNVVLYKDSIVIPPSLQ